METLVLLAALSAPSSDFDEVRFGGRDRQRSLSLRFDFRSRRGPSFAPPATFGYVPSYSYDPRFDPRFAPREFRGEIRVRPYSSPYGGSPFGGSGCGPFGCR